MSREMAKYRLKIVFENKDVEETEVRFDDILNNKEAVFKVLSNHKRFPRIDLAGVP